VLVEAAITQHEARFTEPLGEEDVVRGDHLEQFGEGSLWEGGDLDLPTRFHCER
jgi:hypothetical protein